MNTGHTFSCYNQNLNKKNLLKLWIRIQQYTATDFQGWSGMTLKTRAAYFSIFGDGFRKNSLTAIRRTT